MTVRDLPGVRRPDWVVALITLLSLPLFVYGLGQTYLWQDEAQTALLGRSVLRHGVPMVGQGADSLSAVRGRDAGIGGIYFQISWLQAYVAAASFAIFGESSWAARLPFALAGWLCVPLVAWTIRNAGGDLVASRLAALLTALSVTFLIAARQARYYALTAAVTLAAIGLYAALHRCIRERSGRTAAVSVLFGAAAMLLALSLDVTAIGILGALALHWLLTASGDGSRWSGAFWIPWMGGCAVLSAWLGASMTAASRQEHAGLGELARRFRNGAFFYLGQINAHLVPLPLLLALVALWRPSHVRANSAAGNRQAAVLLMIAAMGGIGGAMLSPFRFVRYAVPAFPLMLGLAAIALAAVWSRSRWGKIAAGAAVLALVTSTAPLVWSHAALSALARGSGLITVRDRSVDYRFPLALLVGEFRDPPRGPIAAVVEYLREHAAPGDAIVAAYGDLPLKFHTTLDVYGGETGQVPPEGISPEWIWPRNLMPYGEVRPSVEWIRSELSRGGYRPVKLPAIDRRWENREDPAEHIFSNPGPDGPPVVLHRRLD